MALTNEVLNLARWARHVFFPQCSCRSRSSFSVSCYVGTNASDSGESLHCFLVGENTSYSNL